VTQSAWRGTTDIGGDITSSTVAGACEPYLKQNLALSGATGARPFAEIKGFPLIDHPK
jgi:hypothetical protein